jgi:dihydrofolate reductase
VESPVDKAKQAAGDKNVDIVGAQIALQCLKAGLLDEIQLDLLLVLLGGGVRLFENLGNRPLELEPIGVVQGSGVTHLQFRVVK